MNILAVGAHPDDIEYNVGGTLLKYKKQGHKIFIALTTSGNTGSNVMTDTRLIGETREKEMLKAAEAYDAQVRFLRNDDERLLDTNETRTQVLDAMRWANPDVIFTHSPIDESPDHWMTSHLVRAMVLSLPGINQQASEKPCDKHVSVFTWEPSFGVNNLPEAYVSARTCASSTRSAACSTGASTPSASRPTRSTGTCRTSSSCPEGAQHAMAAFRKSSNEEMHA